jgi:C-terminal processing protease CtpA/Prc
VVFVTDAESAVPPIAVALQGAGQALIVSSAPISSHAIVTTKTIALGAAWRARIRVGQIGEQIAADVIAANPMAEALELVSGKKAAPAARPSVSRGSIAEPRWRPDATYREMPYPDLGHRLLAAFRIWSVIDYFYPYKALIGDWDAVLTESIPRFITASNEDEYVAAVLQMMSRIEDGHTSASGHPALARLLGAWRPPLEVRLVENEFVVTRLYEGLPPGTDVRVGDIVVSVDGEPMGARAARLRMFVTASTDTARRNRVATVALQGPAESTATLAVRGADQRTRILNVPRQPSVRPSYTGEPYRLVESAIGYVDLRRLTVPQVDAMFETLKTTTAIIFDMRGYPMGTAWDIAPRLNTKGAKVGAWFRRAQVSGVLTSEEGSAGFFFEQPLPTTEKPKYAGLTVMLIDDRAISQAEHSGLFYEAANGMTFVGTPTAGANGDVTNFFVPGGIRINFSGHDVRHADGRQLQRVGLQPDVAVTPTIAGLRAGRDEVLERAIAYVKERSR